MRISDWSSDVCSSDLGIFLGMQYPVEIPGVSNVQFLRTALNAQRRARGQSEVSAGEFLKLSRAQADALGLSADMLKRPRSEEHTSELQSLMRISYAVFCLTKKNNNNRTRQRMHVCK